MEIEFTVSISLSDRPRDAHKVKAAQQLLLLMAAEIVRASASWNGKTRMDDPPEA
jgi:hypothetical protein